MKKFIVYALVITGLSSAGCALYDKFTEKKVATFITKVEEPTENDYVYNSTLVVHNPDGSLNFIIDPAYLENPGAEMPDFVDVYHNEDGSIDFKTKKITK